MTVILFILLFLASLFSVSTTQASCNGSSPNWTSDSANASVTTCVSSMSSGDTLTVSGSGTVSWTWTATKAMIIIGPGKANLTITGGFNYSPTSGESAKTFEMSGFTFSGNNVFNVNSPSNSFPIRGLKIHDNRFTGASVRSISLLGNEFGVFYNNSFDNNFISVSVATGNGAAAGVPFAFGSANYPYFEDNTFGQGTGEFISETGQSGRLAFRHNSVTGYSCSGCEVHDVHGDQDTGGTTLSSEYYHNTYTNDGSPTLRWMHHRGGQAIIINNNSNVNIGSNFQFTEYRSWCGNNIYSPYPAPGQINNSFYANNKFAGANYPPHLTIFDDGDGMPNPPCTTNGNAPAYDSAYVVLNRDYWLPTSGTLAALPATCVANGNTYYATTDTDEIFKCTSTNTWTIFFEPYTYPHPLRGAAPVTPPILMYSNNMGGMNIVLRYSIIILALGLLCFGGVRGRSHSTIPLISFRDTRIIEDVRRLDTQSTVYVEKDKSEPHNRV